jgi:hypothetical protein
MWGEGQGVKKKNTFENMELTPKILPTLKMKAPKKNRCLYFPAGSYLI